MAHRGARPPPPLHVHALPFPSRTTLKKESHMSSRSWIGRLAAVAAAAVLFAGCRHARTVTAPAVAPKTAAVQPAPVPETRVASPSTDFVSPKAGNDDVGTDPLKATELADQKGWIRDAFYNFNSSTLTPDDEANLD